jgi:hypothetical protein
MYTKRMIIRRENTRFAALKNGPEKSCNLLGYHFEIPKFLRSLLPLYSRKYEKSTRKFFLYCSEDGVRKFFRNVKNYRLLYTSSYPRILVELCQT